MNTITHSTTHIRGRKGSITIVVMIAVAIAFVMSLTFLLASTTTTGIAKTMHEHARARQIAESGLMLAIRYVEQSPDWRDNRVAGVWFNSPAMYGGGATVTGQFDPNPLLQPISIADGSFETEAAELGTPLANPPMSGTIGGWQVARTAAVETGPTVPRCGVEASADATDGTQWAFVQFLAAAQGTATFSQTLPVTLAPNSNYALHVDVTKINLASQLADREIRVYAGSTLLASSADPSVFTAFTASGDPSIVTTTPLQGGVVQDTLRFSTDGTPPTDPVRIELYAEAFLGLYATVSFDNVHLEVEVFSPVTLTSVGRCGGASHVVEAVVAPTELAAPASIVTWSEP
jgi:HpiC1 cyclase